MPQAVGCMDGKISPYRCLPDLETNITITGFLFPGSAGHDTNYRYWLRLSPVYLHQNFQALQAEGKDKG